MQKHSQSAKHLVHARSDNIGLLFSTIANLRIFFSQATSVSHPSYVNSTVSYAPVCQGIWGQESKIRRWSVDCEITYRKEKSSNLIGLAHHHFACCSANVPKLTEWWVLDEFSRKHCETTTYIRKWHPWRSAPTLVLFFVIQGFGKHQVLNRGVPSCAHSHSAKNG